MNGTSAQQTLNLSILELITLASIIEKETGHPSERALIASVFHNRMKKNMRLESDPTAVYGIEPFEGKITRRHVQAMTPYNTYRIQRASTRTNRQPGPGGNRGDAISRTDRISVFCVQKRRQPLFFADLRRT
jgi:UPF0755 protein